MSLKIYIPDVQNPIDVPDETLSTDEIRASLQNLFPVVEFAPVTRTGNVLTFARAIGGSKAR